MSIRLLKASFVLVSTAVLIACGGGGGSTTSSAPTTPTTPTTPVVPVLVNPITVVPAMGGFSAGANVTFLDPTGKSLGAAQTNTLGVAVVDIGKYSGPFISQVTGGPNVTVYNERTQGYEPFGATNSLLAVIPSVPTGSAPRLGVTPLTNAAAAVLIPNPLSPVIPGTTASIQAAVAVANATVAVAAGLPAGVSLLSAPEPLTSPTSKITTTDPAAAAYGAFLASLAINSTGSLISSASSLSKDAAANNGALPASANLLTTSAATLSAIVSANVAPASLTSLGASLTNLTKAVVPDPKLANASSLTAISSLAVSANGGVSIPPTIVIPVAPPPVTTTVTTAPSLAVPAAPVAPPAPTVPAGTTATVTTVTPAACLASVGNPTTVYASQAGNFPTPGTSVTTAGTTVTAPLLSSYVTTGTSLPSSVTNTTWSTSIPTFNVASTNNWFSYLQVTNSGCASGTYTSNGVSTTITAGTTLYILNATTANPTASYLPSCPTSTTSASGTLNVTVNGVTFSGSIVNGVIYGFFPQASGSGSGLFQGTISGSSGGSSGSSGLVLTTNTTSLASGGLGFASGTASGIIISGSTNVVINNINYNVFRPTNSTSIQLICGTN